MDPSPCEPAVKGLALIGHVRERLSGPGPRRDRIKARQGINKIGHWQGRTYVSARVRFSVHAADE